MKFTSFPKIKTKRTVYLDHAAATTMEVLRPLVGMDKDEITNEAERIGTLPISNIPDQDCCQLFTPRHPSTRARREDVERAEAALPIDAMVETAVTGALIEDFRFPMKTEKVDS